MQIFDADYLNELTADARGNQRKRQHKNVHQSYSEPCQRFFNGIEPDSYIRPHKHSRPNGNELLVAVRGLFSLLVFDELGAVNNAFLFGSCSLTENLPVGCEVPENTWHTVIALSAGSVLLEVKAGPFLPERAKQFAQWAPEEGSSAALKYHLDLVDLIKNGCARSRLPK